MTSIIKVRSRGNIVMKKFEGYHVADNQTAFCRLKYKLEFKKALARNDLFGTSYMEILDD
jgi:hypothetical protein